MDILLELRISQLFKFDTASLVARHQISSLLLGLNLPLFSLMLFDAHLYRRTLSVGHLQFKRDILISCISVCKYFFISSIISVFMHYLRPPSIHP